MKLVLASSSPRRKELLQMMGYDFTIDVKDVDENIKCYKNAEDYVSKVSILKNNAVNEYHKNDIVISCDTVVVLKGKILGKPKDKEDFKRMINLLKNRHHYVLSGLSIYYKNILKTYVVKTKVYIDDLNELEINEYINMNEGYDKAGGYAVQGYFGKYIKKIEGDYYNVMGLPINLLNKVLKKLV